ncbi:MAG: hypothetical protein NTW72_04575 [Gemmatimonadetes bacterium]|jgi:hypothetical protein|nr:hypothetical protein [Gemmatimonadota bacterium]
MTGPNTRGSKAAEPKRLHLIMRDTTMLDGEIYIGDDAPLVQFLANRKGGWMNMVHARRPKLNENPGHIIVQTDHIVLASAPDGNVLVLGQAAHGVGERAVDIVLVGGTTVKGVLPLAPQQRLSDYLNSSGRFIGVKAASLASDGRALGDVVIHSSAITMLRETRESAGPAIGPGD